MFSNKSQPHCCCGLVYLVKQADVWGCERPVPTPIPLISVNVTASVVHAVAQVEVTQVYVNKEELPIEAIYYFPVSPEGAVTHFQAEVDGRVIKGIVKPHEEAKEAYVKAVANQTTAFLGESTKADIFKVGFLKPGAQVKVIVGYVTEVKNEPGSDTIRFCIPTTVAPRYVSQSESASGDSKAEDIKRMKFSPISPAPLSLKVAVSLLGGIKSIESPTHSIKVDKAVSVKENEAWRKAVVELMEQMVDMDKDFVLNIVPEDVHNPRLYSETLEDGSTAAMVHFVPSFKLDEQKAELIFVLDRSGSMMGRSIGLAKQALLLFLHSLPTDCYFNVIGFGSVYRLLFRESIKYDALSLRQAISHADNLQADMGGTEILQPLREIYSKPSIEGYLRQIFVLTDGEVSNTDAVIGITQANAHKARVFALGIGDAASHYLVEGLAKAGGGTSAFVTYNESIDKKVLNQLKNALQPSLTEIEFKWEGVQPVEVVEKSPKPPPPPVINKEKTLLGYNKPIQPSEPEPEKPLPTSKQAPKRIPPVIDGSQLVVFGLFQSECPTAISIKAQSPDGPLTLKIEHSKENDVGSTGMLHRLAAVKLVRELEQEMLALQFQRFVLKDVHEIESKLKKEIIGIACKNGISSKYTSFVAIGVNVDNSTSDTWVMQTRNVPSQIASSWHGGGFVGRPRIMQQLQQQQISYAAPYHASSSGLQGLHPFFCGSLQQPQQQQFSNTYEYKANSNLILQADSRLLMKGRSRGLPPGFHVSGTNFGSVSNGPMVGFSASSIESTSGVPSTGSTFGGPLTGSTFGGPLTGSTFGGPLTGSTFGGPSTGSLFGGPSTGSTFGAPSTKFTFGASSTGSTSGVPTTEFTFGVPTTGTTSFSEQAQQATSTATSFSFGNQAVLNTTFGSGQQQQSCAAPEHPVDSNAQNSTSSTTPLLKLIRLQSFDGSYDLEEKLSEILGITLEKMKQGAKNRNLDVKVFATSLAISYFVNKLSSEQEVWELIVSKARKWLARNIGPDQVNTVIDAAATFI